MADLKPPRLAGGEAQTLHALLQYQRESLLRKVDGVDEDRARWSPVDSGTSLLWLVTHMAAAEVTWVLHRFAGQDPVPPGPEPADGTLRGAVDAYRQGWQRVDAVAFGTVAGGTVAGAGARLDELCRRPDAGPPVSLRWVLMHLLEETARHAGHADIIRELIDGATGRLRPRQHGPGCRFTVSARGSTFHAGYCVNLVASWRPQSNAMPVSYAVTGPPASRRCGGWGWGCTMGPCPLRRSTSTSTAWRSRSARR